MDGTVASLGPAGGSSPPVDVLMVTFNSAACLDECLDAIQRHVPVHHLVVVDRFSTDGTPDIARRHGATVQSQESGVGQARLQAMALADTPLALFVDSDVIIERPGFIAEAMDALARPGTGAVVGCSVGHPFEFGLPLGLTLFRLEWGRRAGMATQAQGQETVAFRRAIRRDRLRVRYVPDAMRHLGTFRRADRWPEWQGAQTRLVAGRSPSEVAYSLLVILLIHLNSRSLRNLAYTPIFWVRFLRGFAQPGRWRFLDRRTAAVG